LSLQSSTTSSPVGFFKVRYITKLSAANVFNTVVVMDKYEHGALVE
jgi:hypothetical protein